MAEEFLTLMAELDSDSQARLSAWYERLKEAGFTGTQTPGLPFHISLATFPLEKEREAAELTKQAGEAFSRTPVQISHMGLFAGGRVLFCGPERNPRMDALHAACEKYPQKYPWTPHVTLLIDEPDTVCAALPVLVKHFTPFAASIAKLRLCAFWPVREIANAPLRGEKRDEAGASSAP